MVLPYLSLFPRLQNLLFLDSTVFRQLHVVIFQSQTTPICLKIGGQEEVMLRAFLGLLLSIGAVFPRDTLPCFSVSSKAGFVLSSPGEHGRCTLWRATHRFVVSPNESPNPALQKLGHNRRKANAESEARTPRLVPRGATAQRQMEARDKLPATRLTRAPFPTRHRLTLAACPERSAARR